ncbi:unnamed protein product [Rotaria magnacalcarata]|uniref:Uncharacterized protein n=1 Tax=Rotaria magnacalcarata TaxID=392030 RepID=A0A816RQQ1_9BILA|nr:unnamed protein product [Rotaria magnacalcarata]CAF2150663.1 unnamed protein product [Rotaria magnacalcarata]CAF4116051.1 unnamed protein product [Rotaria magnacalcarata]CAF4156723.1 unnamed protein product [Rotaria magnacalcarata]
MFWATLLLSIIYLVTVYSQTWTGTYTVTTTCNVVICCCASDRIVITQQTPTVLILHVSLTGLCFGQTSYNSAVPNPTGYSADITLGIFTLEVTLSADSNKLTITDPMGVSCTTQAAREATTSMSSIAYTTIVISDAISSTTTTQDATTSTTTSEILTTTYPSTIVESSTFNSIFMAEVTIVSTSISTGANVTLDILSMSKTPEISTVGTSIGITAVTYGTMVTGSHSMNSNSVRPYASIKMLATILSCFMYSNQYFNIMN